MVVIVLGDVRPSDGLSSLVHAVRGAERLVGEFDKRCHADRPTDAWRGSCRECARCVGALSRTSISC